MINRVRRTVRQQKSPSPDSDDSTEFGKTRTGGRRPTGSGYLSMLGDSQGSPILTHRTFSNPGQAGLGGAGLGGAGLGASYTISFKSSQVERESYCISYFVWVNGG